MLPQFAIELIGIYIVDGSWNKINTPGQTFLHIYINYAAGRMQQV